MGTVGAVTGTFLLDWAVMTASLVNVILLLWLGLTVILNAERRSWGLWLAGVGLLLGSAFFVSHSAILAHGLSPLDRGLRFWWRAGLTPAILLPFAWYLLILWYTGFWDSSASALHRRQRPWFMLAALMLALGGTSFVIVANPFFSFELLLSLRYLILSMAPGDIPLIALGYPLYIVLCIALSLDALRAPGPAMRIMGELARQRARPWLIATSLALLVVGLLVGWAILWLLPLMRLDAGRYILTREILLTLTAFDLVISALVALATIFLGQAIVAYEIFTGKSLPRHGLRRHWYNAIMLALGYGAIVALSQVLSLRLIYSLLVATLLMTLFYSLLNWRSYAEREHFIAHLRPFVTSQHLYEQLLVSSPHEIEMDLPFRALCRDVLGTRVAYLVAVGPLAPLVGPPLCYPPGREAPSLPPLDQLAAGPLSLSIDPTHYGGALWAIPLWGGRGLIGALLLGAKRDGGLYAQEEIEVARASGERLIDTQASTVMAQRLMSLQRQRLAESQLLDQQTRRVLHDEVLPCLHTAMLALDGQAGEAMPLLIDAHRQISNLLHALPRATAPEVARAGVVGALQQLVREELGRAFDGVSWQISDEAARWAKQLPLLTAEVLFYAAREAMRNAARYGRGGEGERPLHLQLTLMVEGGLRLVVEDDGVGLEGSIPVAGGSGQGLALHSTMMAVVGGTLSVESVRGAFTRLTLLLPPEACGQDEALAMQGLKGITVG